MTDCSSGTEAGASELTSSVKRYTPYTVYKDSGVKWLGEIPAHWEVRRLKHVATWNDEVLPEWTDLSQQMTYVDIGSVDSIQGIVEKEVLTFDTAPSRARRIVRDGDVIVSTVRTYLRAIASVDRPESDMIVSTGFTVLRPRGMNSTFAAYVTRAPFFVDAVVSNSVGVSYPAIHSDELVRLPVTYPPNEEQREISEFLDRETEKVDGLLEKKVRLIELLQEKRTTLITRAVTKGLDLDVLKKDSGVEWLGKIPTHWGVKPANRLANILRGKFTHRPRNDPTLYGGPYPFIQTAEVARAQKHIVNYRQTLNKRGLEVSKMFPRGTLVMTIAANIGDVAILEFAACFPDSVVGFVPRKGVDRDFMYYVLLAMKSNLLREAPVNTQGNLSIERIGSRDNSMPMPRPSEQRAIASHLDRETAKIDALVAKIQEAIDRLKELRIALISAAVTGKIDVREAVP